jgi:hypothetical protein
MLMLPEPYASVHRTIVEQRRQYLVVIRDTDLHMIGCLGAYFELDEGGHAGIKTSWTTDKPVTVGRIELWDPAEMTLVNTLDRVITLTIGDSVLIAYPLLIST